VIQHLFIQDFALIDRLEVSFNEGLSILTGQTGAGKSIIIGALNMVLGERADQDLIRKGATKAVVESVMGLGKNPTIRTVLKENNIEHDDKVVILRREIRDYGSRAFINDHPVPIGVLRQVGDMLVDLHGQHEHQLLLKEDQHRVFLDRYAQHLDLIDAYKTARKEAIASDRELRGLIDRERELRERLDLNRFKLKELDEAGLKEGEEDELRASLNKLEHAEDLAEHAATIVNLGGEGEVNVVDLLRQIIREVEAISHIEPEFAGFQAELEAARVSVDEVVKFATHYADGIDFNPSLLEKMRRRQSDLNKLQKKYLADVDGLIALREQLRDELQLTESFDLEIAKLEKRRDAAMKALRDAASSLTKSRITSGERLAARLLDELTMLGMGNVRFRVDVSAGDMEKIALSDFAEHGPGSVRFLIATNKGEELKPLARIASGGEISRVMLGLKSVLALDDDMPVMIFDEIDTGISGSVSEMVGRSMRKLSKTCQILAITHQPQIAAQADHNYRVEKLEDADRTLTRIRRLEGDERVHEIAELMSGSVITDAALASAREMIAVSR
jgi:DNA repair protein RecN (Recombination protein N)